MGPLEQDAGHVAVVSTESGHGFGSVVVVLGPDASLVGTGQDEEGLDDGSQLTRGERDVERLSEPDDRPRDIAQEEPEGAFVADVEDEPRLVADEHRGALRCLQPGGGVAQLGSAFTDEEQRRLDAPAEGARLIGDEGVRTTQLPVGLVDPSLVVDVRGDVQSRRCLGDRIPALLREAEVLPSELLGARELVALPEDDRQLRQDRQPGRVDVVVLCTRARARSSTVPASSRRSCSARRRPSDASERGSGSGSPDSTEARSLCSASGLRPTCA